MKYVAVKIHTFKVGVPNSDYRYKGADTQLASSCTQQAQTPLMGACLSNYFSHVENGMDMPG